MKRVFLVLIINLVGLLKEAHGLPYPPYEVDVYYIKFNYESGYGNDALTLKKNNSIYVSVPEWLSGVRNEKIAYIKSQSNRKIEAKFYVSPAGYNRMYICAVKISGEGIGNISEQSVYFNGSHYSNPTIMNGYGSVPGSIGKRSFIWRWYVTGIDNYDLEEDFWIGDTGPHEYYTVLAAPQSPMTEPWTSVLDYACDWASGQSSTSSALVELTEELYSCGVKYDGGTHYTVGSYTNLNLTLLLSHLSNPSIREMDCRDFSNFLQVLLNSLGGNCMYNRIDRTTSPYYFIYNYLWPAGWGSKAYPGGWNYHQVGWYTSKVADASTKIDNDADPASSPHLWKLVTGDMTQSAYIDKLTDTPDVTSVATGTCTVY